MNIKHIKSNKIVAITLSLVLVVSGSATTPQVVIASPSEENATPMVVTKSYCGNNLSGEENDVEMFNLNKAEANKRTVKYSKTDDVNSIIARYNLLHKKDKIKKKEVKCWKNAMGWSTIIKHGDIVIIQGEVEGDPSYTVATQIEYNDENRKLFFKKAKPFLVAILKEYGYSKDETVNAIKQIKKQIKKNGAPEDWDYYSDTIDDYGRRLRYGETYDDYINGGKMDFSYSISFYSNIPASYYMGL